MQAAMTVQNERLSTATEPTEDAGIQAEQLVSHGAVVRAHAVQRAEGAIAAANSVVAAAKGKTETAIVKDATAEAEAAAEADSTAPSHPSNQRGGRDRP